MANRSLLVVGSFREETVRRVQEGARAAGVDSSFVGRCDQAAAAFEAQAPLAVLLRTDAPGAVDLCAHVRAHARFADVPILGVARERSDLSYGEMFAWGGDDLVLLWSPQGLARRLRPIAARQPVAPRGVSAGTAIVAGADPRWRSVMGRALYGGGFSVRFAANAAELLSESSAPGVRLVVAAEDVAPDGAAACALSARTRGSEAAWVLVVPPKRMASAHEVAGALQGVVAADGYAPPENVLFLANELLGRRGADQRAAPRLLYGTTVAFRAAGRDEDETGFTYNVSAGGLYVRTLAPLEAGQDVWLELWPPRAERRVRLGGTVVWRRLFGAGEHATVPPGFGVKLTAGLGGDLDRWRSGCEAFAESLLGARSPAPSAPDV